MSRLALLIALLPAAAADPAFTCSAPPALLTVTTAPAFSYSVSLAGREWLAGGPPAVHAGGAWFSAAAAAPEDLCTPRLNVDCVGNDLQNASQPSAGACCAACSALQGCRAWSWQGSGPGPRACYLKSGCDKPVSVPDCQSGSLAAPALPLVALGAANVSGSSAFGAFSGLAVEWEGSAPGGASARLTTTFRCYQGSGLLGFHTDWPLGASATNTTLARPGGGWGSPIAHFPSFAAEGALGSELRWLHVDGIWTLFEIWGTGVLNGFTQTDAPLTLFNASAPAAGTLILSALDSFKAQRLHLVGDPAGGAGAPQRLVLGPYSTIEAVPAGFASEVGLFASSGGVSQATLQWGAALQVAYGTQRLPTSRDVLNGKLSYWSDNGATLFQSYWDHHCPTRNCSAVSTPNGTNAENTFMALKAYHTEEAIPAAIYQLDTWCAWACPWPPRHATLPLATHTLTHTPTSPPPLFSSHDPRRVLPGRRLCQGGHAGLRRLAPPRGPLPQWPAPPHAAGPGRHSPPPLLLGLCAPRRRQCHDKLYLDYQRQGGHGGSERDLCPVQHDPRPFSRLQWHLL